MSIIKEIPRADWADLFERFSNQHRGWLVTLEFMKPAYGKVQAEDLPLEAIRLRSDAKTAQPECVYVRLDGDAPDEKALPEPARVRLECTESGADAALHVDSHNGTTLVLKIASPLLPTEVDDLP